MTVLTGSEFKKFNPGPWFKWMSEDMTHYGFTYVLGLNVDTKEFNPVSFCEPGGLHLIKSIKYLLHFYEYGPILGIFDIPDDAQVYFNEDESKFKCDKVFLLETITSDKDLIPYFKKIKDVYCFWNYSLYANAAFNGHLEVLKWIRDEGFRAEDDICTCAAEGGSLEVLKWLKEKGYPWGKDTIKYAYENGHFEVVKWLKENGCPETEVGP